jgi:hypothetical protein
LNFALGIIFGAVIGVKNITLDSSWGKDHSESNGTHRTV